MKNILIHGLGQTNTSWSPCEDELKKSGLDVEAPDLYSMIKEEKMEYDALLQKFIDYCNVFNEKLNLCGLSLGGILALDYTKRFPDSVNAIIIIGVPYTIPRFLFKLQEGIFHLMPSESFEKMGVGKKEFILLANSMRNLDIAKDLSAIRCKTLILCGSKDTQNMRSAKLFNQHINQSSLQIVENSSHEVNTDNPKKLAEIIHAFWKQRL